MAEDNPIYKFLKENNYTSKSEVDFLNEYSQEDKARELHSFMVNNSFTTKGFEPFYNEYLKVTPVQPENLGESNEVSGQGSQNTSGTSTEPLESSLSSEETTQIVGEESVPTVQIQGTWREGFDGTFNYDAEGYENFVPTVEFVENMGGWERLKQNFQEQYPNVLLHRPLDPNAPQIETFNPSDIVNYDVARPNDIAAIRKQQELSVKPFEEWSEEDRANYFFSNIVANNIQQGNSVTEASLEEARVRQVAEQDDADSTGFLGSLRDLASSGFRAFGSGSARLASDVLGTVPFLNDVIANIIGTPSFRETYGQTFIQDVQDVLKGAISRDELYNRIRFGEEGVIDAFTSGNIEGGVNKLVSGITNSLPIMLSLSSGNVAGLTSTLSMGAGQYESLQSENPEMDQSMKLLNSTLNMYAEMIPEKIGADAVFKPFYDLYKKSGRQVAEQAFSKFLRKYTGQFSALSPTAVEGITEVATTGLQNLIAKYSGEDPNRKLNAGMADAFVIGAAAGGAIASPAQIAGSVVNRANRAEVQRLATENSDIEAVLSNSGLNPQVREALTEKYLNNVSAINNYIEQEIDRKGSLSSAQRTIVEDLEARKERMSSLIENPSVPESVQEGAQQDLEVINDQIEAILNENTKENSETPVEDGEVAPVGTEVETTQELVNKPSSEQIAKDVAGGNLVRFTYPDLESVPDVFKDRVNRSEVNGEVEYYLSIAKSEADYLLQNTNDSLPNQADTADVQQTETSITPENRQALQSSYDRLTEGMTEAQIQSDPDLVRMRNRLSTTPQTETSSTPEQSEIVNALSSDQTFLTRLGDSAQRSTRIQELEQRLRDNIRQAGNLGIAQDGEQQARRNIEFIRDLTEYAVLRIADGTIKTANALADALSIPRGDVNVQQAFNNAQQINAIVSDATVTPRRQTVKSTIRQATQGGTQGRESMTARQALANQMRTLNRGARDMAKNVRELAETVQGYIASQKERFKGVKFNSTELRSIARQVSGIVNEARLEKALNVVERALENAEFRAKLSGITGLQNRAKRMAKSKKFPQRVGSVIREFANINPRNLDDVAQIEQYHGMLENLSKMGVRPSEISVTAMSQIIDIANTNEELSRQERAERREQNLNDPEWQAKQIEKKTKELKRLGFDEAQITDLLDPTKPFDEVMQSLEEAMASMKQTRKDVIRNTANELLTSIKENIDSIYSQMSPSDARNLREFLGSLNIDLIQDNQLLGLNYVLNNILNNNDIQGLGRFKAMATSFDKVANAGLRERALGNLRKIGEQADNLRKKFFATLDIRREAIFKDSRLAGIVDNFFGFQSYESGMLNVKRELKSLQGGIDAIIRKHTKGNKNYWQDSYENAMAGVYAIVAQYRQSWTPEQIQENYVGRIKAVIESLDRLRNEAALTGRTTYDPTIKVLEKVVANIATFTRDSEGNIETVEPKMTLDQMWNELGEGHKEYYNYTRDWFEANKEEFFSVTRMFSNEVIEDDWVNYFPMSYLDYTKTETYGSGARADVDLTEVINGFHLRSTTNNLSGAGTARTIEGDMLPRNKVFNFDLLGNFEREAGKMLADIHTLEDKWVLNNMTDIRNNGLIGDVNQPAGFEVQTALTYRQLVAERIEADQNFLNRGGRPQDRSTLAIWARVMGTTGVIRALGGYAQWVKQASPIVEVGARIKNQKSLLLAAQIRAGFNTGDLDVSNIMSRANVQLRADQESLFNLPNKSRSINAEVEKSLRGLAKDLGIKYEDFLTNSKLGKFSLSPLIESDKYYAEIGWLALYIDNATDGGNKKLDLSEVNEDAVSYANHTNNVVMNTSEISNQGAYAESWLRLFQPMLGFSINSAHGLIISGSKLKDAVRNGDNVGIKRYSAEVLGNFANVAAFGAVSWGVRTAGILGGKAVVELLIKGTEDDEEREKKLLEQVDKIYGKRLLLNDARSINYIATDMVTRGVFSDAVTPLMGALNESLGVQQFLFGEEELREAGYTYKPFSSTNPNPYINALETYAPVMGVQGMGLTATLGAVTNIADAFQTHEDFVKRTRGFSDLEGKNILVDYGDLTPEGIDKFGIPKYMQYSNYLNGVMAMSTMFGISDQTASSMARNSKSAIKQMVKEDRGLVRTGEWEKRIMNARKSFNDIKIGGVKLDLTADEQRKYTEMYLKEAVSLDKEHSGIKREVPLKEYHDAISDFARGIVIVKIVEDFEDVILEKEEAEARKKEEEAMWKERVIELNKKAKQKK